jgi:hypothetical protein
MGCLLFFFFLKFTNRPVKALMDDEGNMRVFWGQET